MPEAWIDVAELKKRLAVFFDSKRREFSRFGSTVNQTFEAFVIAQVVSWYREKPGWVVTLRKGVRRITPTSNALPQTVRRFKFGISFAWPPSGTELSSVPLQMYASMWQ